MIDHSTSVKSAWPIGFALGEGTNVNVATFKEDYPLTVGEPVDDVTFISAPRRFEKTQG
jgi:hypothetical protein